MSKTVQKSNEKITFKEINIQKTDSKLEIKDIKKFYTNYKSRNLIGLEYERISLNKKTLDCASYKSVAKIIETFAKNNNWELIYDDKTLIGAKAQDNTSVSLEPGCQLEISLSPKKNIIDIDLSLNKIISSLDKIADSYDVLFLGYGINPKNRVEDIPLLNKKRYLIMDNYLPNQKSGNLARFMMRKTAGIQINVDYKDEVDAYYKLRFFNLIMPYLEALCSNSPFENNILYDKKSLRANVWRFVGSDRCGFFYKNIFKNNFLNLSNFNLFEKYIKEILNVPLIYFERGSKNIVINGKFTFKEFLNINHNDSNMHYRPKYEDYILHQSLCFPDVRLKNYIEIRNHDSAQPKIALALCAFYKGLGCEDFKKLNEKFSFLKIDEIEKNNLNSINYGLNYKISKIHCAEILEELFNISKNNLSSFDKLYLEPLIEMIKMRKTSADWIIERNIKDSSELVDFMIN